ncbi:YcxB family protein [uncultured Microscilla sp.]|uniref:YcxB family protein n=1 Tax=uncultured Microscilla sp. TaxID=432653 RepID=UPI00261FD1ED|nr:YcxB family protein [uncultured Microscilla sp.]
MIVKTKKFELPKKVYSRIGMNNVLKQQWWIPAGLFGIFMLLNLITVSFWFFFLAFLSVGLYLLFWYIQFAGASQLPQNKMMFEKLRYEIDSRQIMIKLNQREGMPMKWDVIKKAEKRKDYFLFVVSKGQFIYIPFTAFSNPKHDIRVVETILRRKGYIKEEKKEVA